MIETIDSSENLKFIFPHHEKDPTEFAEHRYLTIIYSVNLLVQQVFKVIIWSK